MNIFFQGGEWVLTLQLEHLVHLLDGRIMMQKCQWHGKYVIVLPNNFDYIFFTDIYDPVGLLYVWLASEKNACFSLYQ